MSKFNRNSKNLFKNNQGHIAYKMSLIDRLIIEVLSCFFGEDKFYGNNSSEIINDIRAVCKIDPAFIANLAIYARKEMHLRSISHVLVSELAKSPLGKRYARETINEVIERVDDMSEILVYYLNEFGKPIPNSVKKGIADKLLTFDEYSLAKYNGDKEVKLRDILCLVHPKAKNQEQSNMFKRLLEGNLRTPTTWQTKLSAQGNTKESWEQLIENNNLGYMALLRNLRNIVKANPRNLDKVYEMLANKERVIKSKQLPFRFYTAFSVLYRENFGSSKLYDALETSIKHSTNNVTKLKGKTFVSADVSGSMTFPISANSEITSADIAVLMMAMANYICEDAITSTFDIRFKLRPIASTNGIISNALSIPVTGGGTDITLPIKYLLDNNIYVDRIIILSDNEINRGYQSTCQEYVEEYKKKINQKVWVHGIDMQGYGTQQFYGEQINIIAGWSERTLEFISTVEEGLGNLRSKIENYYFKEQGNYENSTG
ncbi:TROVE domain-containing protein [Clostridium cellulovorans]|uniref:TROVE domain-containing protein n=1 Tax=Clostridium cellulovorans (strain ATCC 35296 / DSM 3052 / OCM 3 / 743B) TaxID=573061 RepID=D9SVM3_CLOC7|nr:TROVE domain-containing protein [Clostridium cellulovorans]ADL53084.1 TROVE domain-containing protein [Clostridium cellulovorans 743B]